MLHGQRWAAFTFRSPAQRHVSLDIVAIFAAMSLDYRMLIAGDPVTTQRFARVARACVRRTFRKPSQIEAVVQDTFVEIMAKLEAGKFPEPHRVETWIWICATNAVRREQTRMRNRDADPYESEADDQLSLSEQMRQREDVETVEAQLRELNAEIVRKLVMRLQGYSYQEIADHDGDRPGTTRMSLSRLRDQLIRRLINDQRLNRDITPRKAHDQSSSTRT